MHILSSELEEVYEQFSRWLENPLLETEKGTKKELDARELAVVRFAGIKRSIYIYIYLFTYIFMYTYIPGAAAISGK